MSTRKPTKPQPLTTRGRKNTTTPNTSASSAMSTPLTSFGNRTNELQTTKGLRDQFVL